MHLSKKTKVYGAVIVGLLITAGLLRIMSRTSDKKPPPSAPGYYTGPMRGKGNPNFAATEDGRQVDLPPLKETPDASTSDPKSTSSAPAKDAL